MPNATVFEPLRSMALRLALLLIAFVLLQPEIAHTAVHAQINSGSQPQLQTEKGTAPRKKAPGGEATLEADQQRQVGKIYYADGHVDVHYANARLRANHVEYNE